MHRHAKILYSLFGLHVGCSSNQSADIPPAPPRVEVTTVHVNGPMPVIMAENMVKDALPALLACWTEDEAPCGTITVGYQNTRHGHRTKQVEGSLKSPQFRQCVQDIIGAVRPPTPKLASPDSGLSVTLVYAPSAEKLQGCQS